MGCKEEREAVLQCYRANRATSSELVYACSRVVQVSGQWSVVRGQWSVISGE